VIASICRPKSGAAASSGSWRIGKARWRRRGHRAFLAVAARARDQQNQAYGLSSWLESADNLVGGGPAGAGQRQPTSRNGLPWRRPQADAEVQLMHQRGGQRGRQITNAQTGAPASPMSYRRHQPTAAGEFRQRTQENCCRRGLWRRVKEAGPSCRNPSRTPAPAPCARAGAGAGPRRDPYGRWPEQAAEAGAAVPGPSSRETSTLKKACRKPSPLDASRPLWPMAVGQAQHIESAVLKLHTAAGRRLGGLQERLWVESGSSTPHLRELLTAVSRASVQQRCGCHSGAPPVQAGADSTW